MYILYLRLKSDVVCMLVLNAYCAGKLERDSDLAGGRMSPLWPGLPPGVTHARTHAAGVSLSAFVRVHSSTSTSSLQTK